MQIVEIDVKNIKPYENNPRVNDNAVEYVLNSIKEFGFKVPVVIDKDNTIICGHTRYKAALKLKLKKIPCVIADELTEEQIKAFRLIDNKTQEISEWDYNKIGIELESIENIDMKLMGFADFLDQDEIEEPLEKKLGGGNEIDLDSFNDDTFSYTCPCCGFKFND